MTQEFAQVSNAKGMSALKSLPWFIKKRRFWTRKWAMIIIGGDTFLVSVPLILMFINDPVGSTTLSTMAECNASPGYRVWSGSIVISCIIIFIQCIILSRKLTIVVDTLGIKKSVKLEGRLGIFTAILYLMGAFIKSNLELKTAYQGINVLLDDLEAQNISMK